MRKILFIITMLLVSVSMAFSQSNRKQTLSVLDLVAKTGLTSQEVDQLTDRLILELYKSNKYTILERSKRDEILREQGFAQSGACNEDACIIEAGQLLSVAKIVGGSVGKLGNTWTLYIRLIDVNTGEIEKAIGRDFKGEIDSLLTIIKYVSLELLPDASAVKIDNISNETKNELNAEPSESIVVPEKKSTETTRKKKSVRKAFFLSLLVPGSGEYYAGQKGYTKGFIAAEAVIWSAALYNKYQGDMRRRDYIAYAAQKSGSNSGRTDDFYYQNIYEWPNSVWYNEDQWRQARELYPYDPAAQQVYVADKLYSSEDAWDWQGEDQWNYYRSLRVKSRNALHRISYSVGAAVLNHMLSAVNAARLAKRFNKQRAKLSQTADWRLECYSYRPETLTLTLWRSF